MIFNFFVARRLVRVPVRARRELRLELFMEKICQYSCEDWGLATRVVRFHTSTVPSAPTMAVARRRPPRNLLGVLTECEDGDEIEIWGDGQQTRVVHVH